MCFLESQPVAASGDLNSNINLRLLHGCSSETAAQHNIISSMTEMPLISLQRRAMAPLSELCSLPLLLYPLLARNGCARRNSAQAVISSDPWPSYCENLAASACSALVFRPCVLLPAGLCPAGAGRVVSICRCGSRRYYKGGSY